MMEKSRIRKAVVAGQFYPSLKEDIFSQIESFIDNKAEKCDGLACVLPHAGYMYSGKVAVETISRLKVRKKIILLGPNHTGYGARFSLMSEGVWMTPLGQVKIAEVLAKGMLSGSKYLKSDHLAHDYEHSLEVELPILQYFNPDFEIVPVTILSQDKTALKDLGREIAEAVKVSDNPNDIMIIASSDMTHYEPQKQAEQKDKEAIEAILSLDEERLFDKVKRLNITMCGYAAVIVMLSAVKLLGAKSAKLVSYMTSGQASGDYESVV
ncbi:MAG: AmmeMemoRadiSam system protein B, partial [Candidatus Omnitrophica bacterium]|nr:AmmeMemoRadiSam system protein B [Candidatus Omnitrophota bacterium]